MATVSEIALDLFRISTLLGDGARALHDLAVVLKDLLELKKVPGTVERGVRPVKGSLCQKISPHLCEDCSERPYTVDGLKYRSTRSPGRYCRRKSRAPRRM